MKRQSSKKIISTMIMMLMTFSLCYAGYLPNNDIQEDRVLPFLKILSLSVVFGLLTTGCHLFLNWLFELDRDEKKPSKLEKKRLLIIKILNPINGIIEIIIYTISILINIEIFIAFWLGVKTALRWDYEKKPKSDEVSHQDTAEGKNYTAIKFLYLRF